MTARYATPADFEWPSKVDQATSAGFDPHPGDADQPVDTDAPLSPRIVRWIHQGAATGCENCGERCDTCDDRMCAQWGPEPRACGTTCHECPCDCTACLQERQDMRDELTHQLAKES